MRTFSDRIGAAPVPIDPSARCGQGRQARGPRLRVAAADLQARFAGKRAIGLKRGDVNLKEARLWVKRVKGSLDTEQPLSGDELRALKRYLAMREDKLPWLFVSERGVQMMRRAVNHMIAATGKRAGLGRVHPHMLRYSCGYALANKGRTSA